MGQCKLVVQISQHVKWAHMSACTQLLSGCCGPVQADSPNITANEMGPWEGIKHKSFQAAVGQLCLIVKAMASALQADAATLVSTPLTVHCEGPHSSLVRHLILCLMGQCELVVQISQYMKWAHASACA